MRVFVTGASGFVGSAVVGALRAAGHQVIGLVRSDAAAAALAATGAAVLRGDVNDIACLEAGVAASDAVIHTAFNHDFSGYRDNCEADRRVILALGAALAGSDRPILVTSATGLMTLGRPSTEHDMPRAEAGPRVASEQAADAIAADGVRVGVVRLSPSVHGAGDHGFVPMLIDMARQKGVSAYIGDGGNLWSALHRLDAGRLYQRAIEQTVAGARYHGVGEEGVPFRAIAERIGAGLGVPVVSVSADEAAAHFGWLAHFTALDGASSSQWTRQTLGWTPTGPGLLADIDSAGYFQA